MSSNTECFRIFLKYIGSVIQGEAALNHMFIVPLHVMLSYCPVSKQALFVMSYGSALFIFHFQEGDVR